ncbi:MAG: nucleoside hydrolase [Bacteroidota bacterium]
MTPRPFLIDTDTGVDDALALMLALRSQEISVKAITTVAGNVEVMKCTRNVQTLIRLLQLKNPPQVAQGARKPLTRKLFMAPEVHGKDGLGNTQGPVRKNHKHIRGDAVSVIIECCRRYGKQLTIVALGPLTNIALAWRKNPGALRKIRRIVTMGGAFDVRGNTGPVAEFNYYVDPEAAQIILDSGLPITMIPLDLTEQVVAMRIEWEERAKRSAGRLAKFILQMTNTYMLYHKKTEGFYGAYLHDPVAVAAAIDPTLVKSRKSYVEVDTNGFLTRGMTTAAVRKRAGRLPFVDIATSMNRELFLRRLYSCLWS